MDTQTVLYSVCRLIVNIDSTTESMCAQIPFTHAHMCAFIQRMFRLHTYVCIHAIPFTHTHMCAFISHMCASQTVLYGLCIPIVCIVQTVNGMDAHIFHTCVHSCHSQGHSFLTCVHSQGGLDSTVQSIYIYIETVLYSLYIYTQTIQYCLDYTDYRYTQTIQYCIGIHRIYSTVQTIQYLIDYRYTQTIQYCIGIHRLYSTVQVCIDYTVLTVYSTYCLDYTDYRYTQTIQYCLGMHRLYSTYCLAHTVLYRLQVYIDYTVLYRYTQTIQYRLDYTVLQSMYTQSVHTDSMVLSIQSMYTYSLCIPLVCRHRLYGTVYMVYVSIQSIDIDSAVLSIKSMSAYSLLTQTLWYCLYSLCIPVVYRHKIYGTVFILHVYLLPIDIDSAVLSIQFMYTCSLQTIFCTVYVVYVSIGIHRLYRQYYRCTQTKQTGLPSVCLQVYTD